MRTSYLAGERVKPTYAFVSAYRGVAELGAHTDCEQCEYTLSGSVDETSPDGAPWPLWFWGPTAAGARNSQDLWIGFLR